MNKWLMISLGLAILVIGGLYSAWSAWHWVETTDNAYVGADIEPISAKIAGYVAEVLVGDNAMVSADQVLIRLDRTEYQAKVDSAEAALNNARANLTNLEAQTDAQKAQIAAALAEAESAKAEERRAKLDRDRFQALVKADNVSRQKLETAEADLAKAKAALDRTAAAIHAAQGQLEVIATARPAREALVAQAQAALDLARDDLAHCDLRAMADGVIGRKSVVPGQYVRPGAVLMAVVPINAIYVDANFKETQLTHMAVGQKAVMRFDAYPDVKLTGHVVSFAPASGAVFSLLPPENATGNFTKVVQRIPVRIAFDDLGALKGKLRPGLSVAVSIDTKSGSTP